MAVRVRFLSNGGPSLGGSVRRKLLKMPPAQPTVSLRRVGTTIHLCKNEQPILLRGGEVGNSSASSNADIERVMGAASELGLNVVLAPICWDLLEPEEGTFDFTLLKSLLDSARDRDLHLILLWFGTWKNSMSCYVPGWVKRDSKRFKRVVTSDGKPQEMLSPACPNSLRADAEAYRRLLEEVELLDREFRTILMVQVENEVGMIPEPMDHSETSRKAFQGNVPTAMLELIQENALPDGVQSFWQQSGSPLVGSWEKILGPSDSAKECFTAWQLANYCEAVTAAGREVSSLPTFANAALIRPGFAPGRYPSGGPLPHLRTIWERFAPSIDFIAPDIYFPNFTEWAKAYVKEGKALFIPEAAPSARIAANTVFAIGELGCFGVCPFAFEDMSPEKQEAVQSLNRCLASADKQILAAQSKGRIAGLVPSVDFDWKLETTEVERSVGDVGFRLKVTVGPEIADVDVSSLPTHGNGRWEAPNGLPLGGCLVLELAEGDWLMIGNDCQVQVFDPQGIDLVGLESCEEGLFEDGAWVRHRSLNGDQTHQGRQVQFHRRGWTIQRVKLYRY